MVLANFSDGGIPSLPNVPGFQGILIGFFIAWILLGLLVGFGMGLMATVYINGSYLMMFFLTLGLQPYLEVPFSNLFSGIIKIGTGDPNDFISGTVNHLIYLLLMFLVMIISGTSIMLLIFLIFFRKWFKAIRRKANKSYRLTSRISGAVIGATVSMTSFTYINNVTYVVVANYESNSLFDGLRNFYGDIPLLGKAKEIKDTINLSSDLPKQLAGITDLAKWIDSVKSSQASGGGNPASSADLKAQSAQIAQSLAGLTAPGGLLDNKFLKDQLLNSPELKNQISTSLTDKLASLSLDSIKGTSIPSEFLDPSLKDQVVNNKDKLLGLFQSVLGDKYSEAAAGGSIQEKLSSLFNKFSSSTPSIANVVASEIPGTAGLINGFNFTIDQSQASTWDNFADTPISSTGAPSFMTISIASNFSNTPKSWELVIYNGDFENTGTLASNKTAFETNYTASITAFNTWKSALRLSNANNLIFTPTGTTVKSLPNKKVLSFPSTATGFNGDNFRTTSAYTFKLEYWKLVNTAFVKDSHENTWSKTVQ